MGGGGGRIGVGCFVIVGTIYEAEFSKRPWKGGFTSPSCVRTAQIRVTVQPSSLPFQQLTTPSLLLSSGQESGAYRIRMYVLSG